MNRQELRLKINEHHENLMCVLDTYRALAELANPKDDEALTVIISDMENLDTELRLRLTGLRAVVNEG
jgi:hypothetical protein